jgi:hypothetical protein
MSPSLLSFAAAGAFCLLLGLWSSAPAEENFAQVMFYNYTSQTAGNGTDHIDTVALWDRSQVTVLAKQDGNMENFAEMSSLLTTVVEGNESAGRGWETLNEMATEGKEPVRLVLLSGVTARFVNPDVTVTFTNDQGPSDSIMGKTTLKGVKTLNGVHIISAEITVFRSDELYERQVLLATLRYEFGHALGLQHSTSEEGIMYPMMTYKDGAPNERVGECEFAGLRSLYVDSVIKQVKC